MFYIKNLAIVITKLFKIKIKFTNKINTHEK